jgi:hypothetical protein
MSFFLSEYSSFFLSSGKNESVNCVIIYSFGDFYHWHLLPFCEIDHDNQEKKIINKWTYIDLWSNRVYWRQRYYIYMYIDILLMMIQVRPCGTHYHFCVYVNKNNYSRMFFNWSVFKKKPVQFLIINNRAIFILLVIFKHGIRTSFKCTFEAKDKLW